MVTENLTFFYGLLASQIFQKELSLYFFFLYHKLFSSYPFAIIVKIKPFALYFCGAIKRSNACARATASVWCRYWYMYIVYIYIWFFPIKIVKSSFFLLSSFCASLCRKAWACALLDFNPSGDVSLYNYRISPFFQEE